MCGVHIAKMELTIGLVISDKRKGTWRLPCRKFYPDLTSDRLISTPGKKNIDIAPIY